eukprot:COSAG02_NODE_169_length_31557_cov_25.092473_12_plen_113_part_00
MRAAEPLSAAHASRTMRLDSGPNVADAAAVLKLYEQAREKFPGAEVVSGGLDVIVEALLQPAARGALPVLTGEIGDTWAYGISSDPNSSALADEPSALLHIRDELLTLRGAD